MWTATYLPDPSRRLLSQPLPLINACQLFQCQAQLADHSRQQHPASVVPVA